MHLETFKRFAFKHYAFAIVLTLCASGAAFASDSATLHATSHGRGLSFSTTFDYDFSYLRIVGPHGYAAEQRFGAFDELAFSFERPPADGAYSWEMRSVQSDGHGLRRRLEGAEDLRRFGASSEPVSHTFSGTFQVRDGLVETPSEPAGPGDRDLGLKDQVLGDDVIVDGSLCVGTDCSDGEVFGYDTIRLRENNLRIHFDDTSSASGNYPNNDWRIEINDRTNGGASYFGITDATANRNVFRVEAGAPKNALYVRSSGNVGLGTSTPTQELQLSTDDSPTLRLEQNGQSWPAYTWDVGANEANFFVRDMGGGDDGVLPFRIKAGAPANSILIDVDGGLCLGCGDAQGEAIRHSNGAKLTAGGTWTNASSRSLKQDIRAIDSDAALAALAALEPVTFRYRSEPEETYAGFIAEDVPELVAMNDRQSLTSMDVVAVLTKALQHMREKMEHMEARLAELDRR